MYHTTETAERPTSSCRRPAGARRRARSSTRSGGSACSRRSAARRGRRWPTSTSSGSPPRTTAAARCSRGWDSPEAVFQILKRLSAGRPCDFSGIARLPDDRRRTAASSGRSRPRRPTRPRSGGCSPTAGFYHPDGRARFVFENPRPMAEEPDDAYPLPAADRPRQRLAVAHADEDGQVGRAPQARTRATLHVEIHPDDAVGPEPRGRAATCSSSRAGARPPPACSPRSTVPRGQVFLPMHDPATNRPDLPRLRPLLPTALLQGLRGEAASDRPSAAEQPISPLNPGASHASRRQGDPDRPPRPQLAADASIST